MVTMTYITMKQIKENGKIYLEDELNIIYLTPSDPMTYHMNKEEVTLSKLQGLLKTAETGLKRKSVAITPTQNSTPVLAIGKSRGKKRKSSSKGTKARTLDGSSSSGTKKGFVTPSFDPKEAECFYCHEKSHWKRNCPKYQQDV